MAMYLSFVVLLPLKIIIPVMHTLNLSKPSCLIESFKSVDTAAISIREFLKLNATLFARNPLLIQNPKTVPHFLISLSNSSGLLIPSISLSAAEPIDGIARLDTSCANVNFCFIILQQA